MIAWLTGRRRRDDVQPPDRETRELAAVTDRYVRGDFDVVELEARIERVLMGKPVLTANPAWESPSSALMTCAASFGPYLREPQPVTPYYRLPPTIVV